MAKRRETTRPFALRLTQRQLQKLSWFAAEKGISVADAARLLIEDATKNVKPPADAPSREIQASEAEWRAWQAVADEFALPVDELIREAANFAVARRFGNAPQLRGGVMRWDDPREAA